MERRLIKDVSPVEIICIAICALGLWGLAIWGFLVMAGCGTRIVLMYEQVDGADKSLNLNSTASGVVVDDAAVLKKKGE